MLRLSKKKKVFFIQIMSIHIRELDKTRVDESADGSPRLTVG